MNLAKYNKFFVALAGAVLAGLNSFLDIALPFGPEEVWNFVIMVLTALGVYGVPNGSDEQAGA